MKIRTQWEPSVASPYGYVYVTHNIAEDVYYCGKHKSSAFDETYFGSGTLLKKAMSKQPLKDFVCVPIDWAESAEELHEKEVSWIKHFNAVSDPQWYNLIEDSNNYQEYVDNPVKKFIEIDAPFVKVFKKSIQSIAKINLSKAAYRLLLYLLGEVKWDNFFYYNRQKLAKQLQLQPTAISAAFKELLVSEILVVLDAQKFLGIVNPEYSFCGTDITHVKKLFYRKVLDNEKMDSEESTKSRVSNDNHTTESAESQDLKEKLQKSEKHGTNQRQKLLDYLKSKANENRIVYKLVKDIVADTGMSKSFIIEFLKFLEEHELISRPKRGEIYLSEELVV